MLSVLTESKKTTSPLKPKVDKYFDDDLRPITAADVASLRARVRADCHAVRQQGGEGNPPTGAGKGKPRPDAGRRPRRSTNGSKSSATDIAHFLSAQDEPQVALSAAAEADLRRQTQTTRAYLFRFKQRALVGDIHDTLACCGLGIINNPDGTPGMGQFVCDHTSGRTGHAHVMTCHSPFACPVCAPKVAARRARALAPQIVDRVALGCTVSLLTLTLRHERCNSLAEMLAALSEAWTRVTSGRWWAGLRKVDRVSFVRGYDVTWSPAHGWHPHLHGTMILGAEHDDADVCEEIVARWRAALADQGYETTREAQHYHRADNPEAAARYAVTPAAVYESLAMAMKRSRGEGAGLTPFEILERAIADREAGVEGSQWVALWREYVRATKGKRQVSTSQDLTLEPEDEEDESEQDVVLKVGSEALREMDSAVLVPSVLHAMDDHVGDPDGMREAVAVVMRPVRAWWSIPGWAGDLRAFRTDKDNIDRRAGAIPDTPEEKAAQEFRERARARLPEPIGAGNRDPAEMRMDARSRWMRHLTP